MSKRTLIYASMFVLAVVTGITVSLLGQPYDTAMFALHKILSIGAIILAVIFIRKQMKETGITSTARTSIIVLSISVFALIATGAMMSLGLRSDIIRAVHALALIPAASTLVTINLSLSKKRQRETSSS